MTPKQSVAMPADKYWLTLGPELLGQAVYERFAAYLDELERRGSLDVMRTALRRYYGGDHGGGLDSRRVGHGGEQGETTEIVVNHYGSIITSLLSLSTASRPAFVATARDDSAESMASTELAEQIWEHELERGVEQECVDAARRMLIFQEVGVGVFWDPTSGDIVAAEDVVDEQGMPTGEQRPIHAGELIVEALSPYDLARDLGARSIRDCKWLIVRRRINRWDLAAQYPEYEQEILSAPSTDRDDHDRGIRKGGTGGERLHSDHVYVLELYAERTRACPGGRYARVIGTCCVEAGELMYVRQPVALQSPERTIDQATGSARTVDLLAPQQAYDQVISSLLSNNVAFGLQNILTAEGQDLEVTDLAGGLQKVEYKYVDGAPPPGAMEMPRLADADMKFAEMLQQVIQVLSGINSVVRGDPEASLKSGAALALVQAMAVQHNSGFQRAYAELLRDVATRVIEAYRSFATTERVIEVTGTDEVRTAREFTGQELSDVLSVRVELANPLLRTIAGKKELADFLISQQWPDAPLTREQYLAFLTTGRLQPLWRAERSEAIAIREECEALVRGESAMVLFTDHHAAHIREHKALLDGRARRELSPQAIEAIAAHINEHLAQWTDQSISNPAVLMATGQQPAPMPMMPGAPPGGPGGPAPANDNGAPPAANDNGGPPAMPPDVAPPMPGAPGEPAGPGMPQMPMVPGTGERAQVPGAGGVVQ